MKELFQKIEELFSKKDSEIIENIYNCVIMRKFPKGELNKYGKHHRKTGIRIYIRFFFENI